MLGPSPIHLTSVGHKLILADIAITTTRIKNPQGTGTRVSAMKSPEPNRVAVLLAVLSVVGFWLMPFSPFVALGAVSMTREESGWPRALARTGALLCSAYTLLMATLVLTLSLNLLVR
jgi:hypothetical protein